jgi:EKC/KEOPS complex subunit PCC1/LAGE3
VKRILQVEDDILIAEFSTLTIRLARLAANAFLETVDLVVRTMAEFGPEEDTANAEKR